MTETTEPTVAAVEPDAARPPWWKRGRTLSDGSRLLWWRELLITLSVYVMYESIRDVSKSGQQVAFENALRVIDWQKALGIYHEQAIQDWALHYTPLIVASNYFYGTAYIVGTLAIIFWLYHRQPDAYPLWRNTLLIGTLLGLVGFATFPLMPPRLLDVLGDGQTFGFVDTLVKYPTFWSFESSTMQTISNQFAAMPSLHCGWAFWGAAALWPRVKTWWMKAVAILYPALTVFVVVVTGNHYILDAVGGAIVFGIGYLIARAITRAGRRAPASAPEAIAASSS
jgi:hypothetical protein